MEILGSCTLVESVSRELDHTVLSMLYETMTHTIKKVDMSLVTWADVGQHFVIELQENAHQLL